MVYDIVYDHELDRVEVSPHQYEHTMYFYDRNSLVWFLKLTKASKIYGHTLPIYHGNFALAWFKFFCDESYIDFVNVI